MFVGLISLFWLLCLVIGVLFLFVGGLLVAVGCVGCLCVVLVVDCCLLVCFFVCRCWLCIDCLRLWLVVVVCCFAAFVLWVVVVGYLVNGGSSLRCFCWVARWLLRVDLCWRGLLELDWLAVIV